MSRLSQVLFLLVACMAVAQCSASLWTHTASFDVAPTVSATVSSEFIVPVLGLANLTLLSTSALETAILCIKCGVVLTAAGEGRTWDAQVCDSYFGVLPVHNVNGTARPAPAAVAAAAGNRYFNRLAAVAASASSFAAANATSTAELRMGWCWAGLKTGKGTGRVTLHIQATLCEPGFGGAQCAQKVSTFAGPVEATAGNQIALYDVSPAPNTGRAIFTLVSLSETNETASERAPLQLLARRASYPTDTVFDAAISGDNITFVLDSPASGQWGIGVRALNQTAQYRLNVEAAPCAAAMTGPDCTTPLAVVSTLPGSLTASTLPATAGVWQFYVIKGVNSVSVTIQPTEGNAELWAYLRLGQIPTPTEYDYANCTEATCPETARILRASLPANATGDFYIGVASLTADVEYGVWNSEGGACPTGCATHGACQDSVCSCSDHYSGLDCAVEIERGLKGWMWVLIVVGFVAGIVLIAVVVHFVRRSQRRSGFQRV